MSKKIEWTKANDLWQSNPNIIAVWVFGSAQHGEVRRDGDVDIGVLLQESMTFDEQLALLGAMQSAFEFEQIDLVILNEANPMLRFEAISGRRLFCRDISRLAAFASLTAREYEDEMAQWQMALHNNPPVKGS